MGFIEKGGTGAKPVLRRPAAAGLRPVPRCPCPVGPTTPTAPLEVVQAAAPQPAPHQPAVREPEAADTARARLPRGRSGAIEPMSNMRKRIAEHMV